LWSSLRYELSICLDGLKKITRNFSHYSQPLDQDKNPDLPECDTGVLPTQTRIIIGVSVCFSQEIMMIYDYSEQSP
jgi:hypothetical protein